MAKCAKKPMKKAPVPKSAIGWGKGSNGQPSKSVPGEMVSAGDPVEGAVPVKKGKNPFAK